MRITDLPQFSIRVGSRYGRIQNASEYLEEELVRLVGCMV